MRKSFPIQWPDSWRRTPEGERKRHPSMRGAFSRDRDAILRRLNRRGANAVITSDLPLRSDGLPYSNARCEDPAVAVYWLERPAGGGKWAERVLACDTWKTVEQNLRAVHLTVEALCGIERWGCTEIIEKAFAGFAALPPGAPIVPKRGWREVLANGLEWPELGNDELLVIVKSRHRKLIQLHHPDQGGSQTEAADINAALTEAELELAGAPT